MNPFYATPIGSPIIIILTIVYVIVASIVTFDIRLIQAKKNGTLPPDEPMLPSWTGIFVYLQWGIWLAILILNWKYALFIFVAKFILKVLPVLETIGNILMRPFRPVKRD